LNYYLDDDTIHILEPRVQNSGIPQGIFLKRHKLPYYEDHYNENPNLDRATESSGQTYFTWKDLNNGIALNVYTRYFRLVDCDDFTRRFFANEGVRLCASEKYPEDLFAHTRAMINMK